MLKSLICFQCWINSMSLPYFASYCSVHIIMQYETILHKKNDVFSNVRCAILCRMIAAFALDRAIHVGFIQGPITHAQHRIRTLSSAECDRRVVDHGQYAIWRHMLCPVRRPYDRTDPIVRYVQETLQRKGICIIIQTWLEFIPSPKFPSTGIFYPPAALRSIISCREVS